MKMWVKSELKQFYLLKQIFVWLQKYFTVWLQKYFTGIVGKKEGFDGLGSCSLHAVFCLCLVVGLENDWYGDGGNISRRRPYNGVRLWVMVNNIRYS